MAQKEGARPFRVAVVGLPSSSPNTNGAGKSCLCNRFTHRAEDDFSYNHSSVLNHEDFTGQFIVYTTLAHVVIIVGEVAHGAKKDAEEMLNTWFLQYHTRSRECMV